ncbi:MAG: GTPase [bacterium]
MPTNLPSEYFEAERKHREAKTPEEKADTLEHLISTIPKHKGTDKLRAELRRKLSRFKTQAHAKNKTGKHESHFFIEKEGDARVVVVGAANVGKSSLVAKLTHATPEVSESPFSTWFPTPGMLMYQGVHIQLIDTPAIEREYFEPEFIELIRSSDLLLILLDLLENSLEQYDRTRETLAQHKIVPAQLGGARHEPRIKQLPMMIVANKDDGGPLDEEFSVLQELLRDDGWSILPISLLHDRNIDAMIQAMIQALDIIRVFSKPPGKEVERSKPFILKRGNTVGDLALKVHHDFVEKLKTARVWGTGVFEGQHVGRDHILFDGDIVELHL